MEITALTHERLAIGEGERDYQFLFNLAANRGINTFQFGNVQGSSTFGLLRKLAILPRFDKVSTLLVFGDNDEEAGKTFQTIKDGLNESGLASPAHPLQVTRKQGSPPGSRRDDAVSGREWRHSGLLGEFANTSHCKRAPR